MAVLTSIIGEALESGMGKLEPYVDSYDFGNLDGRFVQELLAGKFDDFDSPRHMVSSGMTPRRIAETYLATGAYANIDCPGGIGQLVADYESGKFDSDEEILADER